VVGGNIGLEPGYQAAFQVWISVMLKNTYMFELIQHGLSFLLKNALKNALLSVEWPAFLSFFLSFVLDELIWGHYGWWFVKLGSWRRRRKDESGVVISFQS
jgi:hypothetical protein